MKEQNITDIGSLSLYVHVPFCVQKCPYCGFYSTKYEHDAAEGYLDALRIEATGGAISLRRRDVRTVYIGGGTPTTLGDLQWNRLFRIINDAFTISPDAETTVEANPGTVSVDSLRSLRGLGATRLSIGAQSFTDTLLRSLGRIHRSADVVAAYDAARTAGFANIGLDLIYAVPGQSDREWQDTLTRACALNPEHLSLYCLSLDEGSRFSRMAQSNRFQLPAEDAAAAQYELATDVLVSAGYEQYELSNFSRRGFACLHNLRYWRRQEYLGLGPGASSFLGGRRWRTVQDVDAYRLRLAAGEGIVDELEEIDESRAAIEGLMLGLRLSEGVDLEEFAARYGKAADVLQRNLPVVLESGCVLLRGGRLVLTRRGQMLLDEVLPRLIS